MRKKKLEQKAARVLTDTDGVGEVFQDGLVTGSFGDDPLDLGSVGEQQVGGRSLRLARFAVADERVAVSAGTFEASRSVDALLAAAPLLRALVHICNVFFLLFTFLIYIFL